MLIAALPSEQHEQHRRYPLGRRLHEAARELRQRMSIIVISHVEPGIELAELDYVSLYLVKPSRSTSSRLRWTT